MKLSFKRRGASAAWLSMACGLLLLSGSVTEMSPQHAMAQPDQIAAGNQVFQWICASCHGDLGEGGEGPALIGPDQFLFSYRNGRRLFDYVSAEMPGDDPGSLATQEYYDVLAYLFSQNRWNQQGLPVNDSTLERISIVD